MSENLYLKYQKLTKDKNDSVLHYIENTINKTLSMFVYKNLPETIPAFEFENLLQRNGYCIVAEYEGNLYALGGGLGGDLNAYYKPTKCIVANPYLNLFKEYTIENNKDCVFVKNDYQCNGLLNIIGKYAVLLTDNNISLNNAAILSRLTALISASDDTTKQSAELFINKLIDGEFSIVAENAFLRGVNMQTVSHNNNSNIKDLIELQQYYKSNLLAEIGLNSNYNMKRERLSENEINLNVDEILPFTENMYNCRLEAITAINEKYGTNIEFDFNTAWKTEHENNEKLNAVVETITETDKENETAKIDVTEPQNTEPIETITDNEKQAETNENEPKNDNAETETETNETETETETETENENEKIEKNEKN